MNPDGSRFIKAISTPLEIYSLPPELSKKGDGILFGSRLETLAEAKLPTDVRLMNRSTAGEKVTNIRTDWVSNLIDGCSNDIRLLNTCDEFDGAINPGALQDV